jgi:hypothetical protein
MAIIPMNQAVIVSNDTTVGGQGTKADVSTPIAAYTEMIVDWNLVNALGGGTRSMRDEGETYLPKLSDKESDSEYRKRLAATTLLNVYKDTVDTLAGKPLAEPITHGDDVSEVMQGWMENFDAAGNQINVFAYKVLWAAINEGLTHILIDYPRVPENAQGAPISVEQERIRNLRPYASHVCAHNLLGWRSVLMGGERQLTQVRIREVVEEPVDEFDVAYIEQIRVLEPGKYAIWRTNSEGMWSVFQEGVMTLNYIPLVTIYANRTDFMMGKPLLLDLAHLNITHWQSGSDQRHVLHVARCPLLFGKNLSNESSTASIDVGPNRMVCGPADSDLKFVEHTGAAIDAGRKDLEALEAQMAALGMQPLLANRPGAPTATESAIDKSEADTPLHAIAQALKDGLERAMGIMMEFAGLGKEGGSLNMDTDFHVTIGDGKDMDHLQGARNNGDISRQTLWREMGRRGVLDDEFDPDEEERLLDAEKEKAAALLPVLELPPPEGEMPETMPPEEV